MDIKNNLIIAYCAGYEAAMYDMDKEGVIKKNDVFNDAKKWLKLMIETGVIRLETNINILKGRGNDE